MKQAPFLTFTDIVFAKIALQDRLRVASNADLKKDLAASLDNFEKELNRLKLETKIINQNAPIYRDA